MDNMPIMRTQTPQTFAAWLDAKNLTIQAFAQSIGQGFSTVAKWRAGDVDPSKIKTVSKRNIKRRWPDCPLVA